MKGGAREGAGRKPSGRVTRTIRVDPDLWEWFSVHAQKSGRSISDHLEDHIRKAQRKVKRAAAQATKREEAAPVPAKTGRPAQAKARPPVSRNAPCPCGSGLKFKRCCGAPFGKN